MPSSREYPVRSRDESWLPGRWLCLMNFVRRMGFEHFPSMFGNDGGRTWPCWTLFALAAHPGFPPWSWSSFSNKTWIPACSSSSFLSCCVGTQSLPGQPQPSGWVRSEGWIYTLGSLNPSPALCAHRVCTNTRACPLHESPGEAAGLGGMEQGLGRMEKGWEGWRRQRLC